MKAQNYEKNKLRESLVVCQHVFLVIFIFLLYFELIRFLKLENFFYKVPTSINIIKSSFIIF